MSPIYHAIAALLLAYWTRRAFQVGLDRVGLPVLGRDIAANVFSVAFWFLVAGSIKTFDEAFNSDVLWVWLAAQLPWLLLDLFHAGALRRR